MLSSGLRLASFTPIIVKTEVRTSLALLTPSEMMEIDEAMIPAVIFVADMSRFIIIPSQEVVVIILSLEFGSCLKSLYRVFIMVYYTTFKISFQ